MSNRKGLWVHTLDDKGQICWQGQVLYWGPKRVQLQLFSWWTGYPTDIKTVSPEQTKEWRLFTSQGEWLEAGQRTFMKVKC
jgi:hypothetical protein